MARYADERGYVGVNVDRVYPYAYGYRDWVVRALNEDLPYDRFILDQLAADQIVSGPDNRDLAAMGFLTVGRRFLNNTHDIIDDRIDVVCRGLMGLTVGCARCHDHKYDPIPIKDYYSLYGVFASSNEPEELPMLRPSPGGPDREAFERSSRSCKTSASKFEARQCRDEEEPRREFREKIAVREQDQAFEGDARRRHRTAWSWSIAPAVNRTCSCAQPEQPGPVVPRQFRAAGRAGTQAVREGKRPARDGPRHRQQGQSAHRTRHGQPNLDAPLRRGSARTPSDFGLRSEPPTHRATRLPRHTLCRGGWSTKKLIRTILLSKTYRQESEGVAEYARVDPDNFLLWKMNRRRLDFEAMRDGTLAVAGRMDSTVGGRSVPLLTQPFSRRRTLYGFLDRQNLPGVYRTFDFASPDTHSPFRFTTTVPQQALFLMNSPFLVEQAKQVAARPGVANGATDQRVRQLYRIVLGRTPTDADRDRAVRFIHEASADKPAEKH